MHTLFDVQMIDDDVCDFSQGLIEPELNSSKENALSYENIR